VVFAHGFLASRESHAALAELLASHGYVVAAMDFPLTRMGSDGGPWFEDVRNQPGDVGFVIDELLSLGAAGSGDDLAEAVDPQRVALMGHSLGAFTVFLAGLHPLERHPAVQAVIILSGSACSLPDTTFDPPNVPLLLVYADRDALIYYEDNVPALREVAPTPWWLVTLVDGTHTGFVHQTADLFDGLTHADSVGCDAISGDIPDEAGAEYTAWFEGLGGEVLATGCAPPCSRPEVLERGMSTLRQVWLTDVTVRAFLEGTLYSDEKALEFLGEELGREHEDVTVEVRR